MNWTQRLLFGAAIAVIFASGFLTGRSSIQAPEIPEQADSNSSKIRSHSERIDYLDGSLHLSDEQKDQLMTTFRKWEKDMRILELEDDKSRLSILQNHIPEMRTIMNADQQDRFDSLMADILRKKDQQIRRKTRQLKNAPNF